MGGMKTSEEIRAQILAAAWNRFQHYGFNKTSMVEIARDCNMSAANLYRYFAGKNDIIAEQAKIFFLEVESSLRLVLRSPHLSPGERLEAFILKTLEMTLDLSENRPRVNEVCEHICTERSDLLQHHKEVKISLLAEILAEGNRAGEFDVPDVVATANALMHAIVLFNHPGLLAVCDCGESRMLAKDITALLLNGLRRR